MACRRGRCSRSGAWRPASAASAATRTCSPRSRRSPMTAAARNISPSISTPRCKLIDRGALSPRSAAPCMAKSARPSSCRRAILAYGTGNLEDAANALTSTANFLKRPWLARRRRLPAGRAELRRHPGLECGRRLPEGDRADGPADRRRRVSALAARVHRLSSLSPALMPAACTEASTSFRSA